MGTRTALIVGASGLVGGHLLSDLTRRTEYQRILSLGRRTLTLADPKLEQHVVDFDNLRADASLFAVDDVFCCLGTTIKKAGTKEAFRRVDFEYPLAIAEQSQAQGAQRFLVVTAIGANPRSSIFYNHVKGQVEDALRALGLPTLHIFRPSLLRGHRDESRIGEWIAASVSRVANPLMLGPLRAYRAIDASMVARAMANAALRDESGVHIWESNQIAQLA